MIYEGVLGRAEGEKRDRLGKGFLSFAVHYEGLFPLAFLAKTAADVNCLSTTIYLNVVRR